jgi:hypothetical protein
MTIVITHYRAKRPPRKQVVTVEVPAIVRGKRAAGEPEMTPEERQRRGDAADALFRELSDKAAAKDRQ